MDENTIVVTDELGNEVEYEILFPIETPEEWELVEEVFQSFVSEEDEDETEYCEGEDEDCNS